MVGSRRSAAEGGLQSFEQEWCGAQQLHELFPTLIAAPSAVVEHEVGLKASQVTIRRVGNTLQRHDRADKCDVLLPQVRFISQTSLGVKASAAQEP